MKLEHRPSSWPKVGIAAVRPRRAATSWKSGESRNWSGGSARSSSMLTTSAMRGPRRQRRSSSSTAAVSPATSASIEPSIRLRTQPETPSSRAFSTIHTRKPTPCTRPLMIRRLQFMSMPPVASVAGSAPRRRCRPRSRRGGRRLRRPRPRPRPGTVHPAPPVRARKRHPADPRPSPARAPGCPAPAPRRRVPPAPGRPAPPPRSAARQRCSRCCFT